MTRDRAARLALVLILVTGLLVSRRLGPPRRNLTAEACRGGSEHGVAAAAGARVFVQPKWDVDQA